MSAANTPQSPLQAALQQRGQAVWALFLSRAPRERVLLLAGLAAVLFMLGDRIWLAPALTERKRALSELQRTEQALVELQQTQQLQTNDRLAAEQQRRAEVQRLHQELAALESALRGTEPTTTLDGPRMVGVLEDLVMRQAGRVRLLALRSVPDPQAATPIQAQAQPQAVAAASAPVNAAVPSGGSPGVQLGAAAPLVVYRHGLQLVLAGSYTDLHAYLKSLSNHSQLHIKGWQLTVLAHPELQLTLDIQTLSEHREWLTL